jgi:hypothetical protein
MDVGAEMRSFLFPAPEIGSGKQQASVSGMLTSCG